MTPERWKQTEELYHAARNRPPCDRAAFLAEACPDDEALRLDIESLLNEPMSANGLLERHARMAAQVASEITPGAMSGQTLGVYHLQALLGAGGMGEVYRARDTKLGRDVAIKILPRAVTSDPDRLARFEREARMLAALNHSNICAIYGLEEADGLRFLILELVDGETLGQKLAKLRVLDPQSSGLPLDEVLTVARQIAEALEIAHDKGIIHRDLKPANVTITPDGMVKVLDFGLAKPASAEALGSDPIGGTQAGVILGTAAYMSPQQARGQVVDKRADIWAFGCVLYEMLTGRVAFAGETVSDTIGKILEREPDWAALPPTTPAIIRRLLRRCLAKDPKQRLRDIGDVRIEIDDDRRSTAGRFRRDEVTSRSCEDPHDMAAMGRARRARCKCRRVGGPAPSDDVGESARQRPVHALHGLGGHGRGRRNLARREVRGLSRRSGGQVRPLVEPGGDRPVFQSDAGLPAAGSQRVHRTEAWLFGRRVGDLVQSLGRKATIADGPDRWHATGVPWRGRQHPRVVSRRHPPRLRLQIESR